MMLPYDIFNHFIDHADFNTLINLCYVDKKIRQMCLQRPFTKVLLQFKFNEFYNPEVKSEVLDSFLNDISGNDEVFLREIQLIFGSFLSHNILNKIVCLSGWCNGRTTFLSLLRKILGDLYRAIPGKNVCIDYIKHAKVLYIDESALCEETIPILKRLLGKDDIYDKYNNIQPNYNIVITDHVKFNEKLGDRAQILKFKTRYVPNAIYNDIGCKIMDRQLIDNLRNDRDVLSAFLTFLLIGCRDMLNKL